MKISVSVLFILITIGMMVCINPYLMGLSAVIRYSIAIVWTACFLSIFKDKIFGDKQ